MIIPLPTAPCGSLLLPVLTTGCCSLRCPRGLRRCFSVPAPLSIAPTTPVQEEKVGKWFLHVLWSSLVLQI